MRHNLLGIAVAVAGLAFAGCNSNVLRSGKSTPAKRKQATPAPNQNNQGQSTGQSANAQNQGTGPQQQQYQGQSQGIRPTPTPLPTRAPTPTPPPRPTATSTPGFEGADNGTGDSGHNGSNRGWLSFVVGAISNMEKGYQATNPGFRAVLTKSGRVVAAGAMTIDAVMEGQRVNVGTSSGFPAVALKVRLQFVDGSLSPGEHQGLLRICMIKRLDLPMSQSDCRKLKPMFGRELDGQVNGQLHRPFQWFEGKNVAFTVSNANEIKVTSYGGGLALNSGMIPNLATHHPGYVAAVGDMTQIDAKSPLVLDTNSNGKLDLVDTWDDRVVIYFDLDGDGELERCGWVQAGDGLLALDLNGNGNIDSGLELFGQYSYSLYGRPRFNDGFMALAQYDDNGDGQIDALDKVYSKLRIWNDLNQNGLSEKGELAALHVKDVRAVSLTKAPTFKNGSVEMNAGNQVRLRGSYTRNNGRKAPLADVWFQVRSGISIGEYLAAPIANEGEID